MEKLIYTSLIFLITFSFNAQTLNYSDLNSGTKPKGKFQSYTTKNGEIFNVGDEIEIGIPSGATGNYIYITEMDAMGTIYKVKEGIVGKKSEIKKINARKNNKEFKAVFASVSTGVSKYYYFIEDAIKSGEIKSSIMSSDEALEKLKKAKDKLDLEVISKAEYEKIKAELVKFIK